MERLSRYIYRDYREYPVRVAQFGAGNFMRGFADWMIDLMNKRAGFDAGVAVVQPIETGPGDLLNAQDGLYTLYLQGRRDGETVRAHDVVNCIRFSVNPYRDYGLYLKLAEIATLRFVLSNTTEAGIAFREEDRPGDRPPASFPAKLTLLLYQRFQYFEGDTKMGLIVIPCELIDRNGDRLRELVLRYSELWGLGKAFDSWLRKANVFCSSLVDRIVPGYPKESIGDIRRELGYEDALVDVGEPYHLWVIEGPDWLKNEFPAERAGLNVIFTDDLTPYRTRKVRILNGAHTALVPAAYLLGLETVGEAVRDELAGRFLREAISDEIVPALGMPRGELEDYAKSVLERFENPFVSHYLLSIALNSFSKYKTRVLPSVLEYQKRFGKLPRRLVFSLAALIAFYKGNRGEETIPLLDEAAVLEHFERAWGGCDGSEEGLRRLVRETLSLKEIWDDDLSVVEGLADLTASYLAVIENEGMPAAMKWLFH